MGFLSIFQKSWPVLLLGLLLAEDKFNVSRRVICLAMLHINFVVEVELHMIVGVLGIGVTGESERGGF